MSENQNSVSYEPYEIPFVTLSVSKALKIIAGFYCLFWKPIHMYHTVCTVGLLVRIENIGVGFKKKILHGIPLMGCNLKYCKMVEISD